MMNKHSNHIALGSGMMMISAWLIMNDLPNCWTSNNGKVTGTFNGHNIIYYDATKLTEGFAEVL